MAAVTASWQRSRVAAAGREGSRGFLIAAWLCRHRNGCQSVPERSRRSSAGLTCAAGGVSGAVVDAEERVAAIQADRSLQAGKEAVRRRWLLESDDVHSHFDPGGVRQPRQMLEIGPREAVCRGQIKEQLAQAPAGLTIA